MTSKTQRNQKISYFFNYLKISFGGIISLTKLSAFLLAAILLPVIMGKNSEAKEPDYFTFSAGVYDVNDNKTAGDFRVEYRSDIRFWKLMPFVGLMGTTDSAIYGYAGLGLDIFFGRKIVLTPSAAFGAYEDGDGKELGGTVEFRTGAELAWRMEDYSRIGISLHHISNASIYDSNPGTEMIVFSYSVPFTSKK